MRSVFDYSPYDPNNRLYDLDSLCWHRMFLARGKGIVYTPQNLVEILSDLGLEYTEQEVTNSLKRLENEKHGNLGQAL